MIVSFRHKGLEDFYASGSTRGIQVAHAAKLTLILTALDAAETADHLRLPAFKLHPLKGKLRGHWSIWVNGKLPSVSTDRMSNWLTISITTRSRK